MELNRQKEMFSEAYAQAVAAAGGFSAFRPPVDEDYDGVDFTMGAPGGSGTVRSPKLDIQLKCTSQNLVKKDCIRYPLEKKSYDDLIGDNTLVPRILVVVLVPKNPSRWLVQNDRRSLMRYCGYWKSLKKCRPTENKASVTIRIPLAQKFTVESLTSIMKLIRNGGRP